MIAITTSSSIRVKPRRHRERIADLLDWKDFGRTMIIDAVKPCLKTLPLARWPDARQASRDPDEARRILLLRRGRLLLHRIVVHPRLHGIFDALSPLLDFLVRDLD